MNFAHFGPLRMRDEGKRARVVPDEWPSKKSTDKSLSVSFIFAEEQGIC